MKTIFKILITLPIAAALAGCCNNMEKKAAANDMPTHEEGYEQGVSALYGATYDNSLYIAGGCNFPGVPAAEGGSKRYYKGIYKSNIGDGYKWEKAGELPQPSAYGVSVQKGNKWYIAGGMNEQNSLNTTYCITIGKEEITTDTLAPLPCAIDNAAGCITAENILYIAGGNADGKASARLFALNLNTPGAEWEEVAQMPTPRVQPVCAATGNNVSIWGGFCPGDASNAKVYTDGIIYEKATDSHRALGATCADGDTITLSGGAATATDNNHIYATGGVNKDIFLDAISGNYKLIDRARYMTQPAEWYRFNSKLLRYDTKKEQWSLVTDDKKFARAGALLLNHNEELIYIGGELKPGIRTPQISTIQIAR